MLNLSIFLIITIYVFKKVKKSQRFYITKMYKFIKTYQIELIEVKYNINVIFLIKLININ